MTTRVIVLNGGSSSGKSGIARCLQAILPEPWLSLGVDMLIEATPFAARTPSSGIQFPPGGAVVIGPEFRALDEAWAAGVAAMAQAGARIIVDDVFLGGAASQQRWRQALGTLPVLWAAASQAEVVHQGVTYDVEVDTTHTEALDCARVIAARVA